MSQFSLLQTGRESFGKERRHLQFIGVDAPAELGSPADGLAGGVGCRSPVVENRRSPEAPPALLSRRNEWSGAAPVDRQKICAEVSDLCASGRIGVGGRRISPPEGTERIHTDGGPFRVTCVELQFRSLPDGMWTEEHRLDTFEELYRQSYAALVDLCRRTLCGHGDPEAVAQEAFARAWTSLDRFSGTKPFWPWVATIARRLCIDHRRRLERQCSNLHIEATISEYPVPAPDELVEVEEEHRCVREALSALRPAEQRVITLRDVDGWSYDEIARVEGVTIEAIRGSLKRARASLRRSLSRL